ncbi:MAG: hypothetical protein Q8S55_09350, partial [Methylococcaceae bacterium]|nr:hypothetical protein [Methylococcaceae bacterium]
IGFSHPKARYFLLRGQKKVSKEKAARTPLVSCALPLPSGVAKWGSGPIWQRTASLPLPCPYGLFPMATTVLGALHGSFGYAARNISY